MPLKHFFLARHAQSAKASLPMQCVLVTRFLRSLRIGGHIVCRPQSVPQLQRSYHGNGCYLGSSLRPLQLLLACIGRIARGWLRARSTILATIIGFLAAGQIETYRMRRMQP